MSLPTDPQERKRLQLYTFMFQYFPDAWLAVVDVARKGNDQHNPGEPLHWAREKSTDQMNAAFNHIFDYGSGEKKDVDGCWHLAKAIWRLKAQLQLDIEADQKHPLGGSRTHSLYCGLDTDHAGDCTASPLTAALVNQAIDRFAELGPSTAHSGSSGSECLQQKCGQTPAPDRASSPDRPQGPRDASWHL